MKKFLSLTMSLIIAISTLGAFSLNASAALSPIYNDVQINHYVYSEIFTGSTPYGEYEYAVSEYNKACLTKFLGEVTADMVIPSEIDGKIVAEIGNGLFMNNKTIQTVKLPENLLEIGSEAFYGCTNLREIEIPEGTFAIGQLAFAYCDSLTSVTFPNSVLTMDRSFDHCTNLEEICLGDKFVTLSMNYHILFDGCTSLQRINVSEGNPYYKSVDGVLFDKEGEVLIRYPNAPMCIDWDDVQVSCYYDEEKGLFLSEGEEIHKEAVTSYSIPYGVKEIEDYAFNGADQLCDLTIPESVEIIGDHAVGFTALEGQDGTEFVKNDMLTIYCYRDSAAAQYAMDNGFDYSILDNNGDLNDDGTLDIVDVVLARAYIVGTISLLPEKISIGDVNDDGSLDIVDVVVMRQMIIYNPANF